MHEENYVQFINLEMDNVKFQGKVVFYVSTEWRTIKNIFLFEIESADVRTFYSKQDLKVRFCVVGRIEFFSSRPRTKLFGWNLKNAQ